MAEALLRAELKKRKIKWWDVASRGINAETDNPLSQNSYLALAEIGIEVKDFKPKQLTKALVESSTMVVTMTERQKLMLGDKGNVRCVKEICGYDVPDPYGCGLDIYRMTRDMLKNACDIIIEEYILKYEE